MIDLAKIVENKLTELASDANIKTLVERQVQLMFEEKVRDVSFGKLQSLIRDIKARPIEEAIQKAVNDIFDKMVALGAPTGETR